MDPRFPWLFPRLDGCEFGRGRSELLKLFLLLYNNNDNKASVLESSL